MQAIFATPRKILIFDVLLEEMNDTKTKEWYSPWPDDVGQVLSEQLSPDQKHKVFVLKCSDERYQVYLYELTDSDAVEGRSDAVGWFRVEGPSTTDSLDSANAIAAGVLSRVDQKD